MERGGQFDGLPGFSLKLCLYDVFKEIITEVNRYNRYLDCNVLIVSVDESSEKITVSIESRESNYSMKWSFRTAIFSDSGVVYTPISDWDELDWHDEKQRLFNQISDNVTINGNEQITKLVTPGWHVTFTEKDSFGKAVIKGKQRFPDDASFRNSLNSYLQKTRKAEARQIRNEAIEISVELNDSSREVVIIQRGSFEPGGVPFGATLHKYLADRIVQDINKSGLSSVDCLSGYSDYTAEFGPCEKSASIY